MTEAEQDSFLSYTYGVYCLQVKMKAEREGKTLSLREIVEAADKLMAMPQERPACSDFAPSHEGVSRPFGFDPYRKE